MLMLPIVVWSPLEQYSGAVDGSCPKCRSNGQHSQLTAAGWTDGSSTDQPRLLYCVNTNVVLVSRIYRCTNDHRVLGHNADIIQQLPIQLVPFHLWHVAGFTSTLIDHIIPTCIN